MPITEGSGPAFSTDPHLNDSINEVLTELGGDPANGAGDPPTQGGSPVESPREIPTPTPGDSGPASPEVPASPAAPANGTTPAPAANEPEPPTEPFAFEVNGERRQIAEFVRIPGEGVFVPEAHVPRLQQLTSRAEANDVAIRAAEERVQSAERLTTWTTRQQQGYKPDGSANYVEKTLTGRDAVEASRVYMAQMAAKVQSYEAAFAAIEKDPTNFAKLYTIFTDEKGEYGAAGTQYVIPNAQGFADLRDRASLSAREWSLTARQHVSSMLAPQAPPPAAEAPASELAMPTINQLASEYKIAGLTDADKQSLAAHFDRYVIMTDKGRAVDPRFLDAMKERAAMRAETSKVASSKEIVDKFNRGQDKGRAGQRPAAPPPAAPIQPPTDSRKRRSRNERTGKTFDELFAEGMADPDVQAALQGTG